jgi:transposase
LQGKKVKIVLRRRKYFCPNTECVHKTFAERYRFFDGMARKTKRLESEILRVSLSQSSVSASEYLKYGVADAGKSTICNMLKKETPITNKSSVRKVCIDDFALKKRQRYGTIMVDIETRRTVDMIASREGHDVSEWLKEYPNIELVARDGSLTYAAAITAAHPKAMQVSDRFHIIKNLNERAKLCLG